VPEVGFLSIKLEFPLGRPWSKAKRPRLSDTQHKKFSVENYNLLVNTDALSKVAGLGLLRVVATPQEQRAMYEGSVLW
jgi:hypothetical protein